MCGFALWMGLCIQMMGAPATPADVAAPPADAMRTASGLAM